MDGDDEGDEVGRLVGTRVGLLEEGEDVGLLVSPSFVGLEVTGARVGIEVGDVLVGIDVGADTIILFPTTTVVSRIVRIYVFASSARIAGTPPLSIAALISDLEKSPEETAAVTVSVKNAVRSSGVEMTSLKPMLRAAIELEIGDNAYIDDEEDDEDLSCPGTKLLRIEK
jgi:hypothetical protein